MIKISKSFTRSNNLELASILGIEMFINKEKKFQMDDPGSTGQ